MRHILCAMLLTASCSVEAMAFELKSADVTDGAYLKPAQVANVFGCDGGNLSPALAWTDPPEGTKSFVVTMYDPDAPTGSGFWHWVAFDIPADVRELPQGAGSVDGKKLPPGTIQSRGDANLAGYLGACPPPGSSHRYVITLKALKVDKLGLDASASGALVGFMSNASKLGEATITATYGR
jgi:Raf kinase inhibitor-like YbhB/YbcL family protein